MPSEAKRKQYQLLNGMKFIAAFFVVTIHCHFPGTFGNVVTGIARFAVPFFFMSGGFFCYYEDESVLPGKILHKIKHIFVLMTGGIILYFIYGFAANIKNIPAFFKAQFAPKVFLEFLLFNQTKISEPLWFLPAFIYVYAVFYLIYKTGFLKKSYILIPVLFIAGAAIKEAAVFSDSLPDIFYNSYLVRNFLFIGLPFFLTGYFVRKNIDMLTAKLSNPLLFLLMAAGTVEAVSVHLLHTEKSAYFGTFAAVFALFVFVIKNEDRIKVTGLSYLGAKYSFYIYIFHCIYKEGLIVASRLFPAAAKFSEIISPVYPIVIFAVTLVTAAVYVWIKDLLKKLILKDNKAK